jgi:hypothetical protein
MVNAAQIRGLSRPELRRIAGAVFQDGEVDVAVAEPDTFLAGIGRPPIELGQAKMLFVELGGLRGIVGHQCDMLDASHLASSLGAHPQRVARSAEKRSVFRRTSHLR